MEQSSSDALAKLLTPDETAFDMLRRCGLASLKSRFPKSGILTLDTLIDTVPIDHAGSLNILEVEGESGTGKSFVAMSIAAHVAQSHGVVFYFDLDMRLSPSRFGDILRSNTAKDRVFVLRPTTCLEILAAIHHIESFEKGQVRLVVLDSLLSLYQLCSVTDPLAAGFPVNIPRVLFELAPRLGFVVVATKPVVPFKIESKTWTQGIDMRISMQATGRASLFVRPIASSVVHMNVGHHALAHVGDFDFNINA